MKFELLRRPRAYTDANDEVNLLQPRHRLLLALLILAEGPVGTGRLSEQLYEGEENPPRNPADRLYHVKMELSDALTEAEPAFPGVLTENGCYRIPATRQQVDVFRFHDQVLAARAVGRDDAQATQLWRAAISEWGPYRPGQRPVPLAELPGLRAELLRDTLQAEYRAALIACHTAELRLGHHEQLIPELTALRNADESSTQDEELAALLMLACYRSGRRDAARTTFLQLRDGLKEIGLEPSPKLARLYQQIRSGDPALDLRNGAPMSVVDPSLDETPISQEAPDTAPGARRNTSTSEPNAAPSAGPDQEKAETRAQPSRVFGDVHQYGDKSIVNQGQTQIIYQSPEDT